MNQLRSQVLACFKELHKARRKIFAGDDYALLTIRRHIKEEFIKHKDVTDPQKIKELIKAGDDARQYALAHLVQLEKQADSENFRLKITPETHLSTNIMFDENYVPPPRKERKRNKPKDSNKDCDS